MKNVLRILAILLVTISSIIFSYHSQADNSSDRYENGRIAKKEIYYNKDEIQELEISNEQLNIYNNTMIAERELVGLTVSELNVVEEDLYTDEEIEALQRIVEAEATGQDIECKKNVASVILNRVESEQFPDTIIRVIYQREPSTQFSPIDDGRFDSVEITDETIQAVEDVINNGVTTDALYFANQRDIESLKTQRWFSKLEYLFKDSSGHSFYK